MRHSSPPGDSYSAIARWYSLLLDPVLIVWKKKGLRLWPAGRGMCVLDVGCGTGSQLNLYRKAGCRVFGLEFSTGMLATARRNFGGALNLCRADAGMMPYRARTFDWVLISMMLHEIRPDRRSAVLSEVSRVVKDNGRILIIDYQHQKPKRFSGRFSQAGIALIERAAGREHFDNYRNFIQSGGLPPLLESQRLRIERRRLVARGNIGVNLVSKQSCADRAQP